MRGRIICLVLAAVLAACGENPLRGLGEGSSGWISEPEPTVTTQPTVVTVERRMVSSGLVEWWNDDLGRPGSGDPEVVLQQVAERREESNRFVQASRWEIATVLPELRFPGEVPAEVRAVTSQLVLAPGEARLDDVTYAAFGLWSAEPYTRSTSFGRVGVLLVGPDVADDRGCEGQVACTIRDVDGVEVEVRPLGADVVAEWAEAELEYRLEVGSDELAVAMASTLRPLAELNPVVSDSTPSDGLAGPSSGTGDGDR